MNRLSLSTSNLAIATLNTTNTTSWDAIVHAVGIPIATVVVLYILKVGINIFCEYITLEGSKK